MGTTSQKLSKLLETKNNIKNAIISKGITVGDNDTFSTYPNKIMSIEGVNNNPVYKTINGKLYREILNEDFDGKCLDKNLWSDRYLTTWTDKEYLSKADYYIDNSILTLKIEKDSNPWNPINDDDLRVSGVQTGELDGLHKTTPVYRHIDKFLGFIAQYGYFELKAKTFIGEGQHCAWWMIGLQDKPLQKYEIDVFEILGVTPNTIQTVGHPNGGTEQAMQADWHVASVNLNEDYHVYGFEWTETEFVFYLDGVEFRRANISILYPLITILSCYESRSGNWTGAVDERIPYPKEFKIDYLKAYKRATDIKTKDTLTVISIDEINIDGAKTLNSVTGVLDELPSFCYVNWSDGSKTEHWVKWKPCTPQYVTNLNGGIGFVWEGYIADLNRVVNANILEGVVEIMNINITSDLTLSKGATETINLTYIPSHTTQRGISWSSSNESIATVLDGIVTGISDGTCIITATSTFNGNIKATSNVTVETSIVNVNGVTLDKSSSSLTVGEIEQLTASITPANATDKTIIWSSSDNTKATVTNAGVVTAVASGSVTITATTKDGNKTAICSYYISEANSLIVDLNETTTQTASKWSDGSGNGNDFTFNAWGSTSGFVSNALYFDGVAGTLERDMANVNKSTLTFMLECKFEIINDENYVVVFPNWDNGFILGCKESRFTLMGYNFANVDLGVGNTVTNKFVITTNSTETKVYVNGNLKATTTAINIVNKSDYTCKCRFGENGAMKFKGTLYNVKMFTKVLTESEIQAL